MGDSTADSQQDGESEVQISLEALGRIFHRFLSEARADAAKQIKGLKDENAEQIKQLEAKTKKYSVATRKRLLAKVEGIDARLTDLFRELKEPVQKSYLALQPLERSVATHERQINDYKERISALELWRDIYDVKDKDIENLKKRLSFIETHFASLPLAEGRPTTRGDRFRRHPRATEVVPVPFHLRF